MPTVTAASFRASFAQRAMGIFLFAGSWMAGVHMGVELVHRLPRLWWLIREARHAGESSFGLWALLAGGVLAGLMGGAMLVFSLLAALMLESTQVVVDDLGLAVDIGLLPGGLARRLGAGRLAWKRITRLRHKGPFFIIEGGGERPEPDRPPDPTLRFITVDELERLVLMVMDRSPHLQLDHDD